MNSIIMRNLIFSIFLFLSAFHCNAQISVIKTNPLSTLGGFVSICYEKTIKIKSSYQISAFYGYDIDNLSGNAIEANIGYRKYITKKNAPRGFYVMPYIGPNFANSFIALKSGVDLGYQWMWKNGIILDAAMGPDYYLSSSKNKLELFDGPGLNLVFTFGYSF